MSRALTVATLFPLATVAAADEANAKALVRRGAARDLSVETVTVDRADSFVDADVYLVGGTGRGGVAALVEALTSTDLAARVADGAVLLAVDAGLDAIARSWVDPSGARHQGLGLAPVTVHPAPEVTGTVVTRPDASLDLPALIGWEAHDLRTDREDGARALFTLEVGAGNRTDDAAGATTEGVLAGSVLGTRLHGPLLALNPEARRPRPGPGHAPDRAVGRARVPGGRARPSRAHRRGATRVAEGRLAQPSPRTSSRPPPPLTEAQVNRRDAGPRPPTEPAEALRLASLAHAFSGPTVRSRPPKSPSGSCSDAVVPGVTEPTWPQRPRT